MARDSTREGSERDTRHAKKRKLDQDQGQEKGRQDKRHTKTKRHRPTTGPCTSLLADEKTVDPDLSLLFAPDVSGDLSAPRKKVRLHAASSNAETIPAPVDSDDDLAADHEATAALDEDAEAVSTVSQRTHSKRKRKLDGGEVEDAYMERLAREEARDAAAAAAERLNQSHKPGDIRGNADLPKEVDTQDNEIGDAEARLAVNDATEVDAEDDESTGGRYHEDDLMTPPPRHETELTEDLERAKANRTAFLSNVTTNAISSKVARKTLLEHLKSFFHHMPASKPGEPNHSIESLRFRSTPYASVIPKKAAFATKQVMDATAHCTNAYVVYSTPMLTRGAVEHLNGSVVLGRHLRVDEVAHPSKIEPKRCVFVGNLGFVDDESNINAANEEDGREKRKPGKQPADVDEGLWRAFSKCGKVESVRVIRDSKTRVGKGIAYVQFENENAVEAALLYEGKKFPPMLPRKLRVSRAKAQKRNAKPGASRPSLKTSSNGYQRKITSKEASDLGRASRLFGRAGAAQVKTAAHISSKSHRLPNGVQKPESFVFEGHRATVDGGKSGLKLGGRNKKGGTRPTNRSAKRGAAFKAGKKGK